VYGSINHIVAAVNEALPAGLPPPLAGEGCGEGVRFITAMMSLPSFGLHPPRDARGAPKRGR
jgi:hypothetical protein